MRKPIIAGNWKMHKTVTEAVHFMEAIEGKVPDQSRVDTVIAPPAICLDRMISLAKDTPVQLAAQNCHFETEGAFTGELSPKALADLGVRYVIIGHSERREYFNEDNQMIQKKVQAILNQNMTPIVCCGESLDHREQGHTEQWIREQIDAALAECSAEQVGKLVIAYEPIWAIGTGKSSNATDANEVCHFIRSVIRETFGDQAADAVRIQYGGSVKPENIKEYLAQEDIDGALVGGASLEPHSFLALLDAVQ